MNARKFFSTVGVAFFLLIVLIVGIQVVLELILDAFAPQALARWPWLNWVCTFAPQYLAAMPVCAVILRRLPAARLYENRLGPGHWFRHLCTALFVMEAGAVIGNLFCAFLSRFTPLHLTSGLSSLMSTGALGISFVFTVVIAPVLEELVFRKALIDRTIVFGDRTAILVSGLLFGIIHGNFFQFFYAFGLGCLFAYIYIRTGRIAYTISFHMAVNFLGGFVPEALERAIPGAMGAFGASGSYFSLITRLGALLGLSLLELSTIVLAIVGLVLFILFVRRRTLYGGQYEMPPGQTAKALFGNAGMILLLIAAAALFALNMT